MPRLEGVPDNISALQGPILLGQLFAWGLLGILVVQLYLYASNFPDDRRWIKCLAWTVFLADVVMTILGTHFAYSNLAIEWGDLDSLVVVPWSMPPQPVICGLITCTVQLFYCWRIWFLSKNKYLPIPIAVISVASCASAAYCGINLGILGDWRKLSENNNVSIVWLGGSAFCDVAITLSMVILLWRANSQVGFKHTHSLINKIIQYTIETGLIPAVGALGELIFFLAMPHNNVHLIFFFTLAKLYSNSMMANLNARKMIKEQVSSGDGGGGSSHAMPIFRLDHGSVDHGGVRITTTMDRRIELSAIERDDLESDAEIKHDDSIFISR